MARREAVAIWERTFVTSEGHPGARLHRALAVGNLTAAEQAAFEVAFVPLAQARSLVELYAEKGDPKYERAALQVPGALPDGGEADAGRRRPGRRAPRGAEPDHARVVVVPGVGVIRDVSWG